MVTNLIPVNGEYHASVDKFTTHEWHSIFNKFSDMNIYQTWSYEHSVSNSNNISHFVLWKNNHPVSAAQVRILSFKLFGPKLGYVRWGPLWKTSGHENDEKILRITLRAMREEYVVRRKLILRIYPYIFEDELKPLLHIFQEEGFILQNYRKSERTLLLDLNPPLDEIRKNVLQKWRNRLNRAEKNNLEVLDSDKGNNLFRMFNGIYKSLLERKYFGKPEDIRKWEKIQEDLPEEMKLKIMICQSREGPGSGAICSAVGQTGVYHFGATNDIGMKDYGSYLVHWNMIKWLKGKGCKTYDLNGINPDTNPGTYRFKSGLAGKNARDVFFLGQFDAYNNKSLWFIFSLIDRIRIHILSTKNRRAE